MSTTQDAQGREPQLMLDWSDDNGKTWSSQRYASFGRVGQYLQRVKFHRLGQARDRIYRVSISDPVKRVILSAELEAEGGMN
jgi:hypothetical protein